MFIDELHTLVGAGAAEGAMDAANIMKPQLARGELRCVGATTLDEYRKYIEKDPGARTAFPAGQVSEPTVEATIAILRGLKERYEVHHGVRIQDAALVAAATLSHRYITEAVRRLTGAMRAHPVLVSGTGRLNAVLMEAFGDRLFAKSGAEAVFGIGLVEYGWGIGVKIEDGSNRGMGAVLLDTLRQLEVATAAELAPLVAHHHPLIRNHEGRVVGEIRPVFALEKVS